MQKDVWNLCSLSAAQTGERHPPRHLIGTQPSREWEIVSLKIGCPLLWLSPPSIPPSKAQGWQSREKHPQEQQPCRVSREVLLETEGQDREAAGWCQAQHRLWSLPALLLLGKVISNTSSTGCATQAPSPTGGVGTEPHTLSLSPRTVAPLLKPSSWAWLLWHIPQQVPHCFLLRNSSATPLPREGLFFNNSCTFCLKEPAFAGSRASQGSF